VFREQNLTAYKQQTQLLTALRRNPDRRSVICQRLAHSPWLYGCHTIICDMSLLRSRAFWKAERSFAHQMFRARFVILHSPVFLMRVNIVQQISGTRNISHITKISDIRKNSDIRNCRTLIDLSHLYNLAAYYATKNMFAPLKGKHGSDMPEQFAIQSSHLTHRLLTALHCDVFQGKHRLLKHVVLRGRRRGSALQW